MTSTAPGSPRALREINKARILAALRDNEALTQAELSRRTQLSAGSVTNIVRELQTAGAVKVVTGNQAGRRSRLVSQITEPGYVLGVDFGRTHVRMCLADRSRQVIGEVSGRLPLEATSEVGVALAEQLYGEILATAGVDRSAVLAAGVGVPGPLDQPTGSIGAGTLLPLWTGLDLRARFTEALNLPVRLENDANLGALGELAWPSAASGTVPAGGEHLTLVYLRLATGIGGGIVIDGRLHRGAAGSAGELGHVTVDENGPLCRCGNRGCLETVASTPVLLQLLSMATGHQVTVDKWVTMAQAGHPASVRLVEDLGRHVGAAVANLCNLINPQLVKLGGPIVATGELLLQPVRNEVRRRALPSAARSVQIEASAHEPRAEVYGALALALDAVANPAGSSSLVR